MRLTEKRQKNDLDCFFSPHKQKEAEKVKTESKENGDDAMEVENGEKEVAGEAKA